MSRKRKRKRSASAGPVREGREAWDALEQAYSPAVSDRAVHILTMISEGFSYCQIVNRMDVTPRDIFDSAQEVLDALRRGAPVGGGTVEGSDDDIPF